jgi:hypothetical protein
VKVDPQFVDLYEREHERVFQVTFALCRDRSLLRTRLRRPSPGRSNGGRGCGTVRGSAGG